MGRSRLRLSSLAVKGFEGAQRYVLWAIGQTFIADFNVNINDIA